MAEIKYKDTIIEVEAGKAVALHTKDTMLTEDIVITADESTLPAEVSTEAEMNALLNTAEVGSIYKYVGESGTYENGALYVVESDGLISFTIDGVTYQAEEGMTWEAWVASEYNTDGYYISVADFRVHKDYFNYVTQVLPTDTITSGTAYKLVAGGGSND